MKVYRHIVMWKFKGTPENRTDSATWMKQNLENLKGIIPGLISIEVGIGTEKEQQFDACLITDFESPEALANYKIHPEHLKISSYCKEHRLERTSFDYWTKK